MILSYSRISTYTQCPLKYRFRYIDWLPQKEKFYLIRGRFIHDSLQKFHTQLQKDPKGSLSKIMTSSYKRTKGEYKSIKNFKPLKQILQKYLYYIRDNGIPNVVYIEKHLTTKIGNFECQGYIDRVDKTEEGTYKIIDYKTGKSTRYLADSIQLPMYCVMLQKTLNNNSTCTGSYLMLEGEPQRVEHDCSSTKLQGCIKYINDVGKKIEEENLWKPRVGPLCKECDYLEHCPVFKGKTDNSISWADL